MLPRLATPTRGREALLDTLDAQAGSPGLTTLWGPGGVGKTRLALELARRARRVGRAVWVVSLHDEGGAASVAHALRAELGIPPGYRPSAAPEARIAAWVADAERPLIVLDEVEIALDEARDLAAALVPHASNLHVLTTSREPLGLEQEQCVKVPYLAPEPAAELFRDAAPRGAFITAEDLAVAVEQLEGLPLAIELAAGRLEVLPLADLVQRLADPLPTLARPGAEGRHATLLRCLEASWRELPPWARRTMTQLRVFAGSFSLGAAEAVLSDPAPPGETVLDAIHLLTRRALLAPLDGERFRPAAFVRAFLDASSEVEGRVIAQHATWFGQRALDVVYAWHRGEGTPDWLQQEDAQLAIACQRAFSGAAPLHTLLPCVVGRVYTLRNHEGASACLALLDRAEQALGDRLGEADPRALGKMFEVRVGLLTRLGDYDTSRAVLLRGLAHAEAHDLPDVLSPLLGMLGDQLCNERQLRDGLTHFRRQQEVAQCADNRRMQVSARMGMAMVAHLDLHWDPAACLAQMLEAVPLLPEQDPKIRSNLHHRISQLHLCLGDLDEAVTYASRSLQAAEAVGLLPSWEEIYATQALGQAHGARGEATEAAGMLARSIRAAAAIEARELQAEGATSLALVELWRDDPREARRWLGEADRWLAGAPAHWGIHQATASVVRALLAEAEGRTEEAEACAREAHDPLQPGLALLTEVATAQLRILREVDALGVGEAARRRQDYLQALEALRDPRPFERLLSCFVLRLDRKVEEALRSWGLVLDGSGFAPPGGALVDIARFGAASRLLAVLATARIEHPGTTVPPERLVAAGWPGELLSEASARNRLHVALHQLRKLGLTLLERVDGAYRLAPHDPARAVPPTGAEGT